MKFDVQKFNISTVQTVNCFLVEQTIVSVIECNLQFEKEKFNSAQKNRYGRDIDMGLKVEMQLL